MLVKGGRVSAEEVTLNVVMDPEPGSPAIFVNHFEVQVNLHEFTILASRLPTKPNSRDLANAQASGQFVIEPDVQLVLPPTLIPKLIAALEASLANYEERWAPVFRAR